MSNSLDVTLRATFEKMHVVIRKNAKLKLIESSKYEDIEIQEFTPEDIEKLTWDHWITSIQQKTDLGSFLFNVHFFSKAARKMAEHAFQSSTKMSSNFSQALIQEYTNITGGAIKQSLVAAGAKISTDLLQVNLPESKPSYDKVHFTGWEDNPKLDKWKFNFKDDVIYCTCKIEIANENEILQLHELKSIDELHEEEDTEDGDIDFL
ncbi:MAG: hypothetical protein AB8G05_15125 [Oligoflexales bacterium]